MFPCLYLYVMSRQFVAFLFARMLMWAPPSLATKYGFSQTVSTAQAVLFVCGQVAQPLLGSLSTLSEAWTIKSLFINESSAHHRWNTISHTTRQHPNISRERSGCRMFWVAATTGAAWAAHQRRGSRWQAPQADRQFGRSSLVLAALTMLAMLVQRHMPNDEPFAEHSERVRGGSRREVPSWQARPLDGDRVSGIL